MKKINKWFFLTGFLLMSGAAAYFIFLKPATPQVMVSRPMPVATVYIIKDATQEAFLLDEEGAIFSGTTSATLKIYSETKNINFKNILAILNKVKIFGIEVGEVVVTQNSLTINSMPKIVLDLSRDLSLQIASLQLILQQAKIDEEAAEFIDLRFDKPVVRFAPKKK